jgi:hypothetical protein
MAEGVKEEEKKEEKYRPEEIRLAVQLATFINRISAFALQQLPRLIVDDDGNILWPEAFSYLKDISVKREITEFDVLDAIENNLKEGEEFKYIMQMDEWIMKNAPLAVRGMVATAFSTAQTILIMNPNVIEELKKERENMILDLLSKSPDKLTYEIMKNRPKITKLITTYVLSKLKVI